MDRFFTLLVILALILVACLSAGCSRPLIVQDDDVDDTIYVEGRTFSSHRNLWIALGVVGAVAIVALLDDGDTVVVERCHGHKCY